MSSWTSRLSAAGGAILLVVALAVGIPSPSGALPGQAADGNLSSPDPQSGVEDDFPGYTGVAEPGTSSEPANKDRKKQEGLGPVAHQSASATDVPGQEVDFATPGRLATAIPPSAAVGDSAASLRRDVRADGRVRVIVTMNTDVEVEAHLSRREVAAQRGKIVNRLATLDKALAGSRSRILNRFTVVPSAVAVLDRTGLRRLLGNDRVAALTIDRPAPMALDVSTDVIDSDMLNQAGVLGNDYDGSTAGPYEVAIVDSGVDNQHEAFTGRIVAQACFSANSNCPNGATSQIGGDAGDNCTFSAQCDHGTHVAGIASGSFYTGGHEGVARGARIAAVQVGSNISGQWRYYFSDLDLALQHVLNLRNGGRRIIAINLSLGGPLHSTEAACGSAFPNTQNLAANLVAAGTAVVAAAGNDGSGTSVSYPGCLPSTYTIAASDDSDVPAGFSNNNEITDWWAPGVSIDAPVTSSTTAHGLKSGTSMATPHVVGAMALLRECVDGNGVPQTLAAAADDLYNTGPVITHDGVSRHRINVLDAATRNVNNNDFASPEALPALSIGGAHNDFDFNVCADAEPGEPGPFSLDNSIWWTWTPAETGTATISTEDGGGFVTTFDTTLTVYTGSTLGGLTVVGADDDSGTGLRSQIVMPVNGGTTYRIKVDGFGATNGLMNLHLELAAPPTCNGVAATRVGTGSNDTITGTSGADVIVAGDGHDTINSLGGNDTICGGAGDDSIMSEAGDDFVLAGPGADIIRGGLDNDVLVGNAGGGDVDDVGDNIAGGPGDDYLDGWVGDDLLIGGPGNDHLRGEAGIDTVNYVASPAGVVADLDAGTATGDGSDTLIAVEHLTGSQFADTFLGDAAPNRLFGQGGADSLIGRGGNDEIRGEGGDDQLRGHGGNDILNGGLDNDTVVFDNSPTSVTADLVTGTANGEGHDTLVAAENLIGSAFADTLLGNGAANRLSGRSGNDTLTGRGGNDDLRGEGGNDQLRGQGGNDVLNGGANNDTVLFDTSPTGVTADLGFSSATGEGNDTLTLVENLIGSAFADNLLGNGAANLLSGRDGNDSLTGRGGDDMLFGQVGNDHLSGGAQNDGCHGGSETDTQDTCETLTGIP